LEAFRTFLTYVGLDKERIRFAWIDPSQRGRVQQELADLEETIRTVGHARQLVTRVTLHV
jgi:coenzyme F420-reducing hydrogenase delta subunit